MAPTAFHIMTKPVGPICNLDCKYCFYLEKEKLYGASEKWRMSDAVLEEYIRQYIASQPPGVPEVSFAWQGGEPTLLGVDFFRKAVGLQKEYANGKRITNAIQTNGTLLDDAWCKFLTEEHFLVGLSLDGPRALHDRYRVDKQQMPTFDAVMRGLECLKKHRTEFNTLTVVSRANADQPLEVYQFLRHMGSGYIQFIPLVERLPSAAERELGLALAEPPEYATPRSTGILPVPPGSGTRVIPGPRVTGWSVRPDQYGEFLVQIFDAWVRNDVGRYFVQMFDVALGIWMGAGSSLCHFAEKCGAALAMEHNGDVYSCDHYVYPRYKLGNLMNAALGDMVDSPQQRQFGADKSDTLPRYCRECSVRFACQGECPKHRFATTPPPENEPGLNYLCAAYKRFFTHIDPHMRTMAQLVRAGRAAADIMPMLGAREGRPPRNASAVVGRNELCPCGSGRKYKTCCGAPPRATSPS